VNFVRTFGLSAAIIAVVACGGTQSTTRPTTQPTAQATIAVSTPAATTAPSSAPSLAPTVAPTVALSEAPSAEPTVVSATPGASLDPSQSDAGVAASVTVTNDTRGHREGTYTIYGVDDEGSECDGSFEEPDYIVVAWNDAAGEGQISRFGVQVAATDIPTADGETTDIQDGGVSFDFEPAGFGTTYAGNATREREGSSVINVTRAGSTLTFDFTGTTWDGVNFEGQFLCADA
jgi:hypothetical protein